jgi:plastocyanin
MTASALLAAAVSAHGEVKDATVVNVQLSEFHYVPAEIELLQNRRYVLHITNRGGLAHDLEAKAFFQTVRFAPETEGRIHDGRIEVPRRGAVDVAFATSRPGVFEMHCTHLLHSLLGMRGRIVVR